MLRSIIVLVFSCLAFGCAFATTTTPAPGAPTLSPRSEPAQILRAPLVAGVELARIEAQGNTWQSATDCEARLASEAARVGASAVYVAPRESGAGKGARCSGVAYAP